MAGEEEPMDGPAGYAALPASIPPPMVPMEPTAGRPAEEGAVVVIGDQPPAAALEPTVPAGTGMGMAPTWLPPMLGRSRWATSKAFDILYSYNVLITVQTLPGSRDELMDL